MSPEIKDLAAALSKAQSEIAGALKTAENLFFKSNYADLGSVWDAIRGPLTKNGLSVSQGGEGDMLTTILMHSSGQWLQSEMRVVALKQDPQAITSAITYMRRTMLASITGCPQIDDDGNNASQKDLPQAKVKEEVKNFSKPAQCPVDGNQKFKTGTKAGKTLWDVFKEDSVDDFSYAKARKRDLENKIDLPKEGKDYVLLCQYEDVF